MRLALFQLSKNLMILILSKHVENGLCLAEVAEIASWVQAHIRRSDLVSDVALACEARCNQIWVDRVGVIARENDQVRLSHWSSLWQILPVKGLLH